MQRYCGMYKHENTLKMGLRWLKDIRETEAATAYARNPHELVRTIECFTHLIVGEIIIHACLQRKASNLPLMFSRLDYPQTDPEWDKFIVIKQENSNVKVRDLPAKFWLKPPYAPTYPENYEHHNTP